MDKITGLKKEFAQLEQQLADESVFNDARYPDIARRHKQLKDILDLFDEYTKLKHQYSQTKQLANQDGELAKLAQTELDELADYISQLEDKLAAHLTPKDPRDSKSCLIEIRAGAGGDEASLFAGEVYRMYRRLADRLNWKVELIQDSPSEVGGFKEVIFMARGTDVYGRMKFESGVHRVQRIPATESQGRVHTSTITVAVMPEAEDKDIDISPNDLKVDTYRSSGNGGQSVNTTDSAVRITHVSSGIVVTCQDEKSQLKNRQKAMSVLKARLLQKKIEEEQAALSATRKSLIGSGGRSEKIRTYNFAQDRITDHRINYSRSNLTDALDGNIDDLYTQLSKAEAELTQAENE